MTSRSPPSMGDVMNALRSCYDPEIPVNIVDLGLVYGVTITDDGKVHVKFTLTAQGCPAHEYLTQKVKSTVESLPGVSSAEVQVVWDPPWTPDKMSAEGRRQLQTVEETSSRVLDFDPSTFKPKKRGHLVKNPDGMTLLINMANNRFRVNDDIAGLWAKSEGDRTVDEITSLVAMDLGISPVELRPQVIELYRSLIAAGLVESSDSPSDHELPLTR